MTIQLSDKSFLHSMHFSLYGKYKNFISLKMYIPVQTLTIRVQILVQMHPQYPQEQLSKCAFVRPSIELAAFTPDTQKDE